jgi:short-subunit dehydrogenase
VSASTSKGTALITGASTGIGAVYADRLAKRGYNLILVARSQEKLSEVAARLKSIGRGIEMMSADLTNNEDVRHLAELLSTDPTITASSTMQASAARDSCSTRTSTISRP